MLIVGSRRLHCALTAVWGLDETGHFKADAEIKSRIWCADYVLAALRSDSSGSTHGSVAQRVLQDLTNVHTALLAEEEHCTETRLSAKEKGKRLMYLFQCDLLPGVSGKILEAKANRDNIRAHQVSWGYKCAGWVFVLFLNLAMITYILLFALNQTTHRQGAWALSFVLWLVVEVFLVSSLTVLFTHVLVPSLIMKDVNKIKAKLIDSIRTFNANMKKQNKTNGNGLYDGQSDSDNEESKPFTSTDFLFLSSRLAKRWSDLREAKIIAQFRTPWPKQSYQRESDVSGMYSKKFSALSRSASILAIFFLSNLLQVPPSLQDMLVQMVTTSAIGYTIVIHIDLYKIFPVLVVVPLLLLCTVVHFFVRSRSAAVKLRMARMLHDNNSSLAMIGAAVETGSASPDGDAEGTGEAVVARRDEALNAKGALNTPVIPITTHISRRGSAMQGLKVLDRLHRPRRAVSSGGGGGNNISEESSDYSYSDESVSSGDALEEIAREEALLEAALNRTRVPHARPSAVVRARSQLSPTTAAGLAEGSDEEEPSPPPPDGYVPVIACAATQERADLGDVKAVTTKVSEQEEEEKSMDEFFEELSLSEESSDVSDEDSTGGEESDGDDSVGIDTGVRR
jgi:hypothetical protein